MAKTKKVEKNSEMVTWYVYWNLADQRHHYCSKTMWDTALSGNPNLAPQFEFKSVGGELAEKQAKAKADELNKSAEEQIQKAWNSLPKGFEFDKDNPPKPPKEIRSKKELIDEFGPQQVNNEPSIVISLNFWKNIIKYDLKQWFIEKDILTLAFLGENVSKMLEDKIKELDDEY